MKDKKKALSSKNLKSASNFIDHILNKQQKRINHEASEMNNYFSKLAVNLSNKENNESNLTTLLKNLPDENYDQSHDFCPTPPPSTPHPPHYNGGT